MSDTEEEEVGEAEEVGVRLPQNRCCRCAYPSDVSGRDKTVCPRDDELGSESGCHETDTANVLTLLMRMIRLHPKVIRYNRGGQKSRKAKRGATSLRMGQVAARQTLQMCLPFRCKWDG